MPNRLAKFMVATTAVCFSLVGLTTPSVAQTGGGNTIIDWVPFIQFGGIEYVDQCAPFVDCRQVGRELRADDLGSQFATVSFRLDGNVSDPEYQRKDGDASYLDAGTPVYTVKTYRSTFRLAAYAGGHIHLYEADFNPNAKRGADLVDIRRKVRYISVNSETDGITPIVRIKIQRRVGQLVRAVLNGHVDQQRQGFVGPAYFVEFHLKDGTVLDRKYWLHTNVLARGIFLSRHFREDIEQALRRHGHRVNPARRRLKTHGIGRQLSVLPT